MSLRVAVPLVAALIIGCGDLKDATGQVGAPASARPLPAATLVPVDPRDLPPPASTPIPTRVGWPARTPQEVAQNMPRDPFVAQQLQDIARPGSPVHDPSVSAIPRLGVPTYVKAYTAQGHAPQLSDLWLVPVLSGDRTVAVFAASVRPDGTAEAGFYSGFEGSFPHPLSRAEAMARASNTSDPAVKAELTWSNLGTRQGLLVGQSEPFWRVVTASGSQMLVLRSGGVIPARELR